MKSLHRFALLLIAASLTTACGGGGDSAVPPVSAAAVITSENAMSVAGAATKAALQSAAVGGLAESGGFGPTAGSATPAVKSAVTAARIAKAVGASVAKIPIGPETSDCAGGGSVTLSGDIETTETLTPGDRIVIVSDNCDEGDGEVVNGRIEFVIQSFSQGANPEQFDISVAVTVTNLTASQGNEFVTVDGDVSITIDTMANPLNSIAVSGSRFSVLTNESTETLSNFSTMIAQDTSSFPAANTLETSGTVESNGFDGSVSYETPVSFQSSGEDYPFAGELLVIGSDGASIRIIALDSVNVRIQIDLDGDGAVDETIDATWEELEN